MNPTRAVGFDVGLRNLGMAVVEFDSTKVGNDRFTCIYLDLIDLNSHVTNEAVATLCQKLDALWDEYLVKCDYVNVEQQPEKQHVSKFAKVNPYKDNTQMKAISHAIQAYFLARRKPTEFVSPKSKLLVYEGPEIDLKSKSKDKYYIRKRMAVAHTLAMLETQQYWKVYIDQLLKKDDVCDAFLQCCYDLKRKSESL